jgi:hypothetical protein
MARVTAPTPPPVAALTAIGLLSTFGIIGKFIVG